MTSYCYLRLKRHSQSTSLNFYAVVSPLHSMRCQKYKYQRTVHGVSMKNKSIV
jgi:hypothetical protein